MKLLTAAAVIILVTTSVVKAGSSTQPSRLSPIVDEHGRFGFVDSAGNVVVAPQFDLVLPFSGDLAAVVVGNRIGFIDPTGEFAVNPKYSFHDLAEGIVSVLVCSFSEDLAVVPVDGKFGFINTKGGLAIRPRFDFATPFHEGLAFVSVDEQSGYIDKTGDWALILKGGTGGQFSDGLAAARKGEKWGYIDHHGQFVIDPQFDSAGPFSDERALVSISGRYGFIDLSGRYVVNPIYDFGWNFSEGLGAVVLDKRIGFVDRDGKVAIEPQFLFANEDAGARVGFSGGFAKVRSGAKYEFIDGKGQVALNPDFDWASDFQDGIVAVKIGSELRYIDASGKVVWHGPSPSNDKAAWLDPQPRTQYAKADDAEQPDAKPIDLFTQIDTARDPIRGVWTLNDGKLKAANWQSEYGPFIQIPVKPDGSYSLSVEFQFLDGPDALYLHVPVGRSWALLGVGRERQTLADIAGQGEIGSVGNLGTGMHRLEVRISQLKDDKVDILVTVDGREAVTWAGPSSKIQKAGAPVWSARNEGTFAIGSKAAVVDSMTLQMLSGQAILVGQK